MRKPGAVSAGAAFLLGAVVGALFVTVAVAVSSADSGARAPNDASYPSVASARHAGVDRSRDASQAAECREVFSQQARVLNAAEATLSQWQVHVDAMNKLVAGKITLGQARAFWNQTRVGAARRLAGYREAALALRRLHATCPAKVVAMRGSSELRSCYRAVIARRETLDAAGVATETWGRHIRDMNMLRMGMLSPAKATSMWLRNWRTGVKQLDTYRAAARRAQGLTCQAG